MLPNSTSLEDVSLPEAFPKVIENLVLSGFRNLKRTEIFPGAHFNVIHGENGAGKSNLLEAIYYLGTLRSFRGARTEDLVSTDENTAVLCARATDRPLANEYKITIGRETRREVRKDGKRPRSSADYRASLQVVVFHPGDVELSTGSPEPRRVFVDDILEKMDPTYGSALATYKKALRSRNRLLKLVERNLNSVTAYDEILASSGEVLGEARSNLVVELSVETCKAFKAINGEELHLEVAYCPSVEPRADSIKKALKENLNKDLERGYTGKGPHADDIEFCIKGHRAKNFASQGQQRSIVLALKVSELLVLSRRVGRVPILLLDDVSSELDRGRNRRFFDLIRQLGGQVFLTTTHPEFILLESNRVDFQVSNGEIKIELN